MIALRRIGASLFYAAGIWACLADIVAAITQQDYLTIVIGVLGMVGVTVIAAVAWVGR